MESTDRNQERSWNHWHKTYETIETTDTNQDRGCKHWKEIKGVEKKVTETNKGLEPIERN